MDINHMQYLPKLLLTTLNQILDENNLSQWNMQVNNGVVYVNLKFIQEGHVGQSTPAPGFRRKSPSEKKRDFQRLSTWQDKKKPSFYSGTHETVYTEVHGELSDMVSAIDLDESDYRCHDIKPGQSQPCESRPDERDHHMELLPNTDLEVDQNKLSETADSIWQGQSMSQHHNTMILKAVEDSESHLIGAITRDNRIAMYSYMKADSPHLSHKLEIIDSSSPKYDLNMDTIKDLDNICDLPNMQTHLDDMCKLIREYDEITQSKGDTCENDNG